MYSKFQKVDRPWSSFLLLRLYRYIFCEMLCILPLTKMPVALALTKHQAQVSVCGGEL